jgi:CRP-like cAMP-binding protein
MTDPKILAAFHQLDVFRDFQNDYLSILADFSAFRTIRTGETLFCQNEPSPYCFGILEGEVTVRQVGKNAQEPDQILDVLKAGRILGGVSLLAEVTRPGLASVTQNGQLLSIWSSRFRSWIEQHRSAGGEPPILETLRTAFNHARI